ncbi:MAG TPA: hypothetical protein VGI45_23935 [Terracidiphilus sp.]|jgi:hypothetical protein
MHPFSRLIAIFCGLYLLGETGTASIESVFVTGDVPAGIRVQGSGVRPQIGFACCEHGLNDMQALFDDPGVIASLKDLHAQVAIPIADFAPERVATARRLNSEGIPVIAWIELDKSEGIYLNADTAPQAAARINQFEKWTQANGLRWAAVGLDIEPNFSELAQLRTHRWRMFRTLLLRSINGSRIANARHAYTTVIAELQSRGYIVQTYQMPYLPAERSVHSTVIDRLLGSVDVRGNEEYLMLYTSFARPVGPGMIWSLGRDAQAISIGVTDGDTPAGKDSGPLDWDEFSRDLIVASHYTNTIGVYDLEGCVRQGFLPRLETMDWTQSVVLPAASVRRAERMGRVIRIVLWTASHLVYFIVAALLLLGWLLWRWRKRHITHHITSTT